MAIVSTVSVMSFGLIVICCSKFNRLFV